MSSAKHWKTNDVFRTNTKKEKDAKDEKGYILKNDVNDPKEVHKAYNDLSFLSGRIITNKYLKLVRNFFETRKIYSCI